MKILLLSPNFSATPAKISHLKRTFQNQLQEYNQYEGTNQEMEFVLLKGENHVVGTNICDYYTENIEGTIDSFIKENNIDAICLDIILTEEERRKFMYDKEVLHKDAMATRIFDTYAARMPVGLYIEEELFKSYLFSDFYQEDSDIEPTYKPFFIIREIELYHPSASAFKGIFDFCFQYEPADDILAEMEAEETTGEVPRELKWKPESQEDK